MTGRQVIGAFRAILIVSIVAVVAPLAARAAPYADMVMDARSGEILRATNSDSRLHPASLTKMMTLYIAFEAIRLGEISLDTTVTISPKAAAEPPSKLGLRAGQRIQLRYLIRAAAVKSANDAATAIGEAIAGSEAAFARRMNRTARALGMTRSTFRNAHGLTEDGHLSTAHDMTMLGRHLFYDYPQYYNLFSRRSADAGGTEVANTNRRFLDAYEGADGIKTGYTRAAGFNLVASAERGRERIIATVFGGASTPDRNARMAELLDLGFQRAPTRVALNRPQLPRYEGLPDEPEAPAGALLLAEGGVPGDTAAGKIIRMSGAVSRSLRPVPRGGGEPTPALLAAIESDVALALASATAAEAVTEAVAEATAEAVAVAVAEVEAAAEAEETEVAVAAPGTVPEAEPGAEPEAATELATVIAPRPRPEDLAAAGEADNPQVPEILLADARLDAAAGVGAGKAISLMATPEPAPAAKPALALALNPTAAAIFRAGTAVASAATASPVVSEPVQIAAAALVIPPSPDPVIRPEPEAAEVVSRLSTSGGRHSGVSLGRFGSRFEAEKALIATALSDMTGLGGVLRRVVQRGGGFEANFMGLSDEQAARVCQRIAARGHDCTPIGG